MAKTSTPPPLDPTTFSDCFNKELKEHYAHQLEKETGHRAELNVKSETVIEADNARIITYTDIVLYNPTGPHSVIDIHIQPHNTPSPPSTEALARIHAQMDGLATDPERPPAVILTIGLNGGTLERHPIEFDATSWNNHYKYLLADIGTESSH